MKLLHLKRRFMKHGFAVWSGTACHEAKPFQASCFFAQKCFSGIAFITFRLSRIFGIKMAAGKFYPPRHSETHFWAWKLRILMWNEILKIASLSSGNSECWIYRLFPESFITPKSDFFNPKSDFLNPSIGPSCKTMCLGRYPSLLIWSFLSVTQSQSGEG